MNDTSTQLLDAHLSKDRETEGLDLDAAETWIYPTNYPVRDYQFNIVQKALLVNTLVSLPTGLGKTFIAAVVMYNFYRWYPQGKIIFMAPTRPLVKQQIDACYDIMGFPKEVTAELTGTNASASREEIWEKRRVFFITPQILQNDLDKIDSLASKIKCVVFDEAHKARGNHAYCEVIRKLQSNKYFRVLALSATPGGYINDVLEVIQNLLISHLEFRTEESDDVKHYVFERNLTTIVVPLGDKLQEVKDNYLEILDYYTRNLIKYKVVQGNCGSLTKGKIFMIMKNFQQTSRSAPHYNETMKNLNICITLYHAFELLVRHGLRSFTTFFEEHIDKPLLRGNQRLAEIFNEVREYMGPKLKIEQLPDGDYSEVSKDVKFGHPKFYKLQDILLNNFKEKGDSSRVIVFFEYRDSVMEAYALLQQSRPLIKPRIFLGQKNGITQRYQLNVVKAFREGYCNVLLSTSIGEEGLDVGDVDLIICFDISNKSPIRMVQRMGRTGRKKGGSIIVLVTEGKEQDTLKDCLIHKNNVTYHVLQSKEITKGLVQNCPKMLVEGMTPKCEKIFITIKKPALKKHSSLKDILKRVSSNSEEPTYSPDLELIEIEEKIPKCEMLWSKSNIFEESSTQLNILNKKISKQRSFQEGHKIQHSKNSEILISLLQLADSKRFNIPATQFGASQVQKSLKQTDIRNMFFRSQSTSNFNISSMPVQEIIANGPSSPEKSNLGPMELFCEISTYLSINSSDNQKCRHCPEFFDCEKFTEISNKGVTYDWVELDCSVFTSVTFEDLQLFKKDLDDLNKVKEITEPVVLDPQIPSQKSGTPIMEYQDIIDKSILTEFFDKSVQFEAPKTLDLLLNKYNKPIIHTEETFTQNPKKLDSAFKTTKPTFKKVTPEEILNFFRLKNLYDLFETEPQIFDSQETMIYSDSSDLFSESPEKESVCIVSSDTSASPILGSRKLPCFNRPNLQRLKQKINTIAYPTNFTMDTSKISSTPLPLPHGNEKLIKETQSSKMSNVVVKKAAVSMDILDLDDFCDMSVFGIGSSKLNLTNSKQLTTAKKDLDDNSPNFDTKSKIAHISDSFNLNDFHKPIMGSTQKLEDQSISKNILENQSLGELCDLSLLHEFGMTNLSSNKEDTKILEGSTPCKLNLDETVDGLVPVEMGKAETKIGANFKIPIHNTLHKFQTNCDTNAKFKENQSNLNSLNLNVSVQSNSKSKLSITQMLSFINKEDKSITQILSKCQSDHGKILDKSVKIPEPQKENVNQTFYDIDGDLDFFNFSFNKKKSPAQKNKSNITNKISDKSNSRDKQNSKQITPIKTSNNSSFNGKAHLDISHTSSNLSYSSDDDFEKPANTSVWIRPKPRPVSKRRTSVSSPIISRKKIKRTFNDFIDDEAEISDHENILVSDDENEENLDCYEVSFVANESHHVDTQMHARYLQSIRSPAINRGKFKIPQRCNLPTNVYSQEVEPDIDEYLDDSFVVDGDEIETRNELSQLEILEMKLEKQRKKRSGSVSSKPLKRRRILEEYSDDSG